MLQDLWPYTLCSNLVRPFYGPFWPTTAPENQFLTHPSHPHGCVEDVGCLAREFNCAITKGEGLGKDKGKGWDSRKDRDRKSGGDKNLTSGMNLCPLVLHY